MIVIVAGKTYIDIDAYASGIAYAKLLRACGKDAIFAPKVKPNASVCKVILDLGFDLHNDYTFKEDDEFVVVDVSSPEFIDDFVKSGNMIEIVDHHFGFKEFWNKKHVQNQIEPIGAVATLIYERIVRAKKTEILDAPLCKLLIAAILDNTVNFTSEITSKRDVDAYHELHKLADVPYSFDEEYFMSCQKSIEENLFGSLNNDMKYDSSVNLLPGYIGQMLIYDKAPIFEKLDEVVAFMNKKDSDWMVNIICLKDKKSYIVANNQKTKADLETLLGQKFKNNVMTLARPMLRKEIIKKAILYK